MILELFEGTPKVKPTADQQKTGHFAWLRTRMAADRTLMASVRTSTALIGFGFTIFQFFERLNQMMNVVPARNPGLARTISLLLVAIGTFSLIIALLEYRTFIRYLWNPDFEGIAGLGDRPKRTPALTIALLVCLIGLVILVALSVRTVQQ